MRQIMEGEPRAAADAQSATDQVAEQRLQDNAELVTAWDSDWTHWDPGTLGPRLSAEETLQYWAELALADRPRPRRAEDDTYRARLRKLERLQRERLFRLQNERSWKRREEQSDESESDDDCWEQIEEGSLLATLADASRQVGGNLAMHPELDQSRLPASELDSEVMEAVTALASLKSTADGGDGVEPRETSLRAMVKASAPPGVGATNAEAKRLAQHSEQHRRGKVTPYAMSKKNGEFTEWQRKHQGASTPEEMRAVWVARRTDVLTHLSDTYMKARCGALRRWIWVAVEVYGTTPWRTHWPLSTDEDQCMMLDFVTDAAIRYKNKVSVEASKIHIEQFHADHHWMAPKFPLTDHYIRKMGRALRTEFPEGRAEQAAYTPADMTIHCRELRILRDQKSSQWEQADVHERLMAMTAVYESAGRAGNYCRKDFEAFTAMWSKATIFHLLHPDERLTGAKAIQLPQPPMKTAESESQAARERAKYPAIFLLHGIKEFSFARACAEATKYRMYDETTCDQLPAFMDNVRSKSPLGERDIADTLKMLEDRNPRVPQGTVIGSRLLRRGFIQSMQSAADNGAGKFSGTTDDGADEAQNTKSTHTKTAGRKPYNASSLDAQMDLLEQTEDQVFEPGADAFRFQNYRGGVPPLVTVRKIDGVCRTVQEPERSAGPISRSGGGTGQSTQLLLKFQKATPAAAETSDMAGAASEGGGGGSGGESVSQSVSQSVSEDVEGGSEMQMAESGSQRPCVQQAAGCQKPASSGRCPKTKKPKIACSDECFAQWKRSCWWEHQAWKQTGKLPTATAKQSGGAGQRGLPTAKKSKQK